MTDFSPITNHDDPLHRLTPAFLEEVLGEEALAWVRARNDIANQTLATPPPGLPGTSELEEEILEILENPDRIPMVRVRGEWAYNVWTDGDNPRGLWRRQPYADYLAGGTDWDVLIDVDALAKREGKSWVWHGASVCFDNPDRALITLSDGGSDADSTREFDLVTRDWVEDGFHRPEAKGSMSWLTEDICWVAQSGDPETTSPSGYPLQAALLRRGQSIEDAQVVFTAPSTSMGIWPATIRDKRGVRSVLGVMEDFYTADHYLIAAGPEEIDSHSVIPIPAPRSSEVSVWNDWTLVWLREDWQRGDRLHTSGSLLSFVTDALFASPEDAVATELFVPTSNEVLEDLTATRDFIVLTTIRDVVSRLTAVQPPRDGAEGEWVRTGLESPGSGADSAFATIVASAVDATHSNDLWLVTTGYTQPSSLWLSKLDSSAGAVTAVETTLVRQAPTLFDADGLTVSQHFATSEDGTKIPYFEVRDEAVDGPAPTLLYGYGGFDVSLLPSYAPAVGRAWLNRGGVYVVANIRGGGEYGPQWHRSALKENRPRAYQDFVAVARDLVSRGVTTPNQLGVQGGSNGGLLVGNMYTRYPDDFGAVLCQVPLLDMGRYHTLLAGHSWVAEYGDPTVPEEWSFIRTFSPVHLFDPDRSYPALMLTTSTKDDRVHPGHARSLGYLAEESGKSVLYFENIEGGHAGAADNRQRAHNQALGWAFLWRELG